jgi:hypothetical protein
MCPVREDKHAIRGVYVKLAYWGVIRGALNMKKERENGN